MEKNAKIFVAGHRGMVGSAIVRELKRQGYTNIVTRTHTELDLLRQADVEIFLRLSVRNMFFSRQLKWEVLWLIKIRSLISCMRI